MKPFVLAISLLGCGCAAATQTAMPRAANALEAVKSLYTAACEPAPVLLTGPSCKDTKNAINTLVDWYTEINENLD